MYSGIILLAALQAAVMCIALAVPPQRAGAERILGILLGVIAIEIGLAAVVFTGQIEQWPHLLKLNTPLAFLYGPLCYWFCAAVLDERFRLPKRAWWHLLPAIVVAAYLLPMYATTADQKLAYLESLRQQPLPMDSLIIGGFKRLQILGYLVLCVILLLRARQTVVFSRMLPATLAVLAMALLWLGDVFDYAFDFGFATVVDHIQMLALALAVLLLTASALIRAQILPRPPRMYSGPGIPEPERSELVDAMRRLFDQERLYLNSRLTLPELADRLSTTPHQVSRLLNEHYGVNFSAFVNRYRVDEATRRLAKPDNRISDVAFASGFNSISTFNAAFKRCMGLTPRQYRDQIMHPDSGLPDL